MSGFIFIRDAPASWTAGVVRGRFSQYGPIEDVTIEQSSNPNSQTNFVIIEFESEEDAEAAVEDNRNSEQRIGHYNPRDVSASTTGSIVLIETISDTIGPHVEVCHCDNSNCTNEVIIENSGTKFGSKPEKIYCSRECYRSVLDMKGRVDIYDKWIASLGRSGTGLLKDPSKVDKLVIAVDTEGIRSVDLSKS